MFFFCTYPLYFASIFLSYLIPSHFIGIFSLNPYILFYFFKYLTPPPAINKTTKNNIISLIFLPLYIKIYLKNYQEKISKKYLISIYVKYNI